MIDMMTTAQSILESVFGFERFRPGQQEIIEAVLAGENVLAVMPTGSGKSLCYQVPAIVQPGLTVVVSPLIALMRDQVRQLRGYGVAAASLNSSNDAAEATAVYRGLRSGDIKVLYMAPERLARPDTIDLLRDADIRLLAIDEAHCVSQWGHDFRPEYLMIGQLRAALGGIQTIALTATADAPTRSDITQRLFQSEPREFLRSFDRPNLFLAMEPKDNARKQISNFIKRYRGMSGIVYCVSRKRTEDLAASLAAEGHYALPYHAGLDSATRNAHQDTFLQEDGVIMVATVAFGMGIDKPDVRFVCHADLPSNVEAYYQEIGRAGRDGLPADTLTLYGLDDMRLRRLQIEQSDAPDARKRIERQRFNALLALCESPRCRRQTLLAYFSEQSDPCGHCDLCINGVESFDGTTDAQKAMSAILRTGEMFGTEHLVQILLGNVTEAIVRHNHDRLPTFGVGKNRNVKEWRSIFRQIYAAGLISLEIADHGRWVVTEQGRQVLRGQDRVALRVDGLKKTDSKKPRKTQDILVAEADSELLDALKALRRQLATAQKQPAYVVFPDRTLIELATHRPRSRDEMSHIHGIGQSKLDRYGDAFLEVLERYGSR